MISRKDEPSKNGNTLLFEILNRNQEHRKNGKQILFCALSVPVSGGRKPTNMKKKWTMRAEHSKSTT